MNSHAIALHPTRRRFRPKAKPVLTHFSKTDAPIHFMPYRKRAKKLAQKREGYPKREIGTKPWGALWLSDENEFGWSRWSVAENFRLDELQFEWEIELDWQFVCHLATPEDIDDFTHTYVRFEEEFVGARLGYYIDWPSVAIEWSAIMITPYQWSRRLAAGCGWYYGWDCATAAILHPRAVKGISEPRSALPRLARMKKEDEAEQMSEYYETIPEVE